MPRADLPVDPPSPLTSSLSSDGSTVESPLLRSFQKSFSYGTTDHDVNTYNFLKEETGFLPLPLPGTPQPEKEFSTSLSTIDVLSFQYDPFWTRLRTGMLAFFWVFLLILLAAAGTTAAFETHVCSSSPPD